MSDLYDVWRFTRQRLSQAIDGLSDNQVTWRQHERSHTIAEILYHIAGAEHYWAARLHGQNPARTDYEGKLDLAVKDGFLRDGHSPFDDAEMTVAGCLAALEFTEVEIEPVLSSPTIDQLEMRLVSPVGDDVSGREGLARLAQHAGYHTGQIWMIRSHPEFPA